MSAITTTLDIGDDAPAIVAGMLRRFQKGSRVEVAISEVTSPAAVPTLEDYRRAIAAAREKAPRCPWPTTAEAMRVLREGEAD